MFDRLESLIGKEKLDSIKNLKVLVIGVGGVGGYVAEGLARCGVGYITIIDGDIIDKTNINRQIIALNSTIGQFKVDVLKERLNDINPDIKVQCNKEYIDESSLKNLELELYDFIVDACDDVKVKVALAKYSLENDINLITSCGTAKKIHPELLEITTLDKTSYDPLARSLRRELMDNNISKLTVLSSTEKPIDIDNGVLGSTSFVPSIGGLLIVSYIINNIIK